MGIIEKPYPDWTTGAIPPAEVNETIDTIINEFDGGINSDNIEEGSLTDEVFSESVSTVTMLNECFADHVTMGLTVSAVGLACTLAGGTCRVSGQRNEVTATVHTVADSTTTYCDVYKDGTISWNANATPLTDYLRLAKIVSASGGCTITDMSMLKPVNASEIEADGIWDIGSTQSTGAATQALETRATLLTLNMDVKKDDTLILLGLVKLSTSGATHCYLGFQTGGANTNLEFPNRIEATSIYRTGFASEIYAVTADNTALTLNLTWRRGSEAVTLTAGDRTLIVVRFRPTG